MITVTHVPSIDCKVYTGGQGMKEPWAQIKHAKHNRVVRSDQCGSNKDLCAMQKAKGRAERSYPFNTDPITITQIHVKTSKFVCFRK